MAYTALKAEQISATALGLLQREILLPNLVWRNAGGSFIGAKNDTISLRVPALSTEARTMQLRASGNDRLRVLDDLAETKVDLTLTDDIYKGIALWDEVRTLDISNFGAQVLDPLVRSVAEGLENLVADTITGATYAAGHTIAAANSDDPYDVLVDARTVLGKRHVPVGDRVLVVGADVENWILKSDHLNQFDQSGSSSALREATIGRLAGNDVIVSHALPADEAYLFHRTAFVLSTQAPIIPQGCSFGTTRTGYGFGFRFIMDYDPMYVQDRAFIDTFAGANVVTDDLDNVPGGSKGLVRAVKITVSGLGS
jgi:hypothetical protein